MTIPTIAELSGNTILELFKSGYNALKNALGRKQDTLVAGSNIVINGNTISAIEGGTAVLDDYYTKEEVDGIATELSADINDKADSDDVYTKSEVDTELATKADTATTYTKSEVDALIENIDGDVEVIDCTLTQLNGGVGFTNEVKDGDIIVLNLRDISNVFIKGDIITLGKENSTDFRIIYVNNTTFNIEVLNTTFNIGTDAQSGFVGNIIRCLYSLIYIASTGVTDANTPAPMSISAVYSKIRIFRKKEVTE